VIQSVEGYIIQNAVGSCLAKALFWYEHENLEEAYVHSQKALEDIRAQASTWETKPTKLIPARWSPEKGTELVGEPIEF
jgi:hypothetical protein